MKKSHLLKIVPLTAALFSMVAWADLAEPTATSTDANQDIPAAGSPSQTNFGRFVKKSKADFEADADLKAQFKNYGQYVSSLHRKNKEHGKSGGAGSNKGGAGGVKGNKGGNGGNGGGGTGGDTGGTTPPPAS
jgi:hypothetical protein